MTPSNSHGGATAQGNRATDLSKDLLFSPQRAINRIAALQVHKTVRRDDLGRACHFVFVGFAIAAIAILVLCLCGCAITRPHLVEVSMNPTNGIVTRKELWLPAFVLWPGTQTLEKQHGSIGKTLNAGFTGAEQDSGGTNLVDALKALDSIVGKIAK